MAAPAGGAVVWPYVAAAGASAASTIGGYMSGKTANDANAENMRWSLAYQDAWAKDSMKFQAEQATNAMDFSERMSSTAHQREMQDLRDAGLNPILSANSGASSPSGIAGGGASGSGGAARAEPVPSILSSAKDALSFMQSISESNSRIESNKATAKLSGVSAGRQKSAVYVDSLKDRLMKKLFTGALESIDRVERPGARSQPGFFTPAAYSWEEPVGDPFYNEQFLNVVR